MAQVKTRREHLTYGDYVSWPEDERWEIIEGVPHAMTPAPTTRHQVILGEPFFQLRAQLQGRSCRAYLAPFDVRLPGDGHDDTLDDALDDTVVQPDLSVICDPAKVDAKGCRGAPDLVVEIISPSTASRDQLLKAALYEKHGVKEYWIVHPVDRLVYIRRLEEGGFDRMLVCADEGTLASSAVSDLVVDLEALFAGE